MGEGGVVSDARCRIARDAARLVAAPFLVKTYRLVDDPSTDHIISWGDNNSTFVVWCPKEFSASVLPSYFNHTNFSSFVRQLNTYGFRKIVRGRCEFANELFRKGQKHLLPHIQRRKPSTSSAQMEYEIAHLKSICSRDITLFILQNSRGTSLADVDRSIHNVSPCSSTEDVAKESSTSPPKLFGVPLY
eukprot:PITA_34298